LLRTLCTKVRINVTEAERDSYRQQLMDLARRLKGDVTGLSREALRHTGGGAPGDPAHPPPPPAHPGTDNFERELTLSLLENDRATLAEIDAALVRLDQGRFGVCEECGREIGRDRLRALPFARFCIDDARRLEKNGTARARAN